MILMFSILVVGAILTMAWAFLSASKLESSIRELEERTRVREAADTAQKGETK